MDELVKQQTETLEAANAQLQRRATEHEQAEQQLKQQTAELTAGNERLREQIREHERAKDELKRYRDKIERRLRKQDGELTAATAQLRDEITMRKQQAEHLKRQTDALKATSAQLQAQIGELSACGPVGEPDMLKATDLVEAAVSPADDEKALLENVFRHNIELQKP